jgi:hypothetical protein
MFLQNWYPRETSLLFTGRQMLCSMSVRKCKLEKNRQRIFHKKANVVRNGRKFLISKLSKVWKFAYLICFNSWQHNGQKKKYKRTNNNQTMSCQKTLETTERKLTAINCNKNNLILISLFDWITVSWRFI